VTCPLIAHRTDDGRVRITAPKDHLGWTVTDAEAKRFAAQLLAATVEDEKFREGAELGAQALDFATRVRKLIGT
jgi:hypothetical protein